MRAVQPIQIDPRRRRGDRGAVLDPRVILNVFLATVVMLAVVATPSYAVERNANASTATIGADTAWSDGLTGAGIQVAIVDTGIATHPDLEDRVVARLDLSGVEPGGPLDGHGHGTFMAGLIAGGGAQPVGVAPEAQLIDVRVGDGEGNTSLPQVVAALHALADTRSEVGTDVVLLSLGADWPGPRDPLDAAIERLWDLGIVVITAAGNDGPDEDTIATPGRNGTVITVGALDDHGTADPSDDSVPSWSSAGSSDDADLKPDLVAPGVSVLSLRAAGSAIDRGFPDARVGDDRFLGSGTSMSAALTAGAAALLLQSDASLTPDAVKGRLLAGAADAPADAPRTQVGHGVLHVPGALAANHVTTQEQRASGARPTTAGHAPGDAHPAAWTWKAWTWKAWTWKAWTWKAWTWKAWTWKAWTWKAWTWTAWTWTAWTWR